MNLTELAAARAKMLTKGEAELHPVSRAVLVGGNMLAQFATAPDARGIVATHNAADVLIEVARAAKAWASPDLGLGEAATAWTILTTVLAKVSL